MSDIQELEQELGRYRDAFAKIQQVESKLRLVDKIGIAATIVALFAGALVSVFSSTHIFTGEAKKPQPELSERIRKLTDSLKEAGTAIDGIQQEIKDRQALVEQLQKEADTANNVKALTKEQMTAVAEVLKSELKNEEKQTFWSAQGLALFYAALGVLLSEAYRFISRRLARKDVENATSGVE